MIRFGTDGIRGLAGLHPITPEVGVAVGRAAVRLAGPGPARVLIARDPRTSGPMLAAAVAAGVAGEGGDALYGGVLPTPGVSAGLAAGLAHTGVMITASHNADPDNGFKVFAPGGHKLDPAQTAAVEAWLDEPGQTEHPGAVRDLEDDALDAWLDALEDCGPPRDALAGRRIAVDLANGAATAAQAWLRQAWRDVDWVFVGAGGKPNHECGSEHLQTLCQAVLERGCDAGLALDGDGDRCRLVDERGNAIAGDAVAWLFATEWRLPALAVTVMSNAGLEASLPGVEVVRTDVGDKHLLAALRARPALRLGSEESGHVVFTDGLPTGDGLLTGLRAMALALRPGQRMSEAVEGYVPYPRRITKVRTRVRPPLDEVGPLERARVESLVRLGPGGRVFLRYSGTEPILRVLVEGADELAVQQVSERVTTVAAGVLS